MTDNPPVWVTEEIHNPKKKEVSEKEIKIIDLFDFLMMEFPKRERIVDPWLSVQGLAMVYAWRGVGKTFFSLNIAYAIATGGKWLKWDCPKPRGVLFLDGEMPSSELQNRLKSIAGYDYKEKLKAPLRLYCSDQQTEGRLNLALKSDQKLLDPYLDGIEVIIVDNLSMLAKTGNEQNQTDFMTMQDWLVDQRAFGRSVIMIHHAGKGGIQRGTSGHEDALDTSISLTHPDGYVPQSGCEFRVTFAKNRLFYGQDAAPFEAKLNIEAGKQVWTVTDEGSGASHGVDVASYVQYFSSPPNQKTLVEAICKDNATVKKTTAIKIIKGSVCKGEIQEKFDPSGRFKTYFVVKKATQKDEVF